MKKITVILIFIISFSGFLATQIIFDVFNINAENVSKDKQKYSVYENQFQSIVLTTTSGKSIDLRKEKSPIILLNFWASWCLPCLKEFPSLVAFQDKYKNQIKVIGVNGDEEDTLKNIKKTEKKYRLNFESVDDSKSTIATKFLINSYPVSIVFHKGKVVYVSTKIHDFMDPKFTRLIDEILNKN